jgi:hypothetical protein
MSISEQQVKHHQKYLKKSGIRMTFKEAKRDLQEQLNEAETVEPFEDCVVTVRTGVQLRGRGMLHGPTEEFNDGCMMISFRKRDNSTLISWQQKQRIKNHFAGEDREAFELFPSVHRLMDTANLYHLWVLPAGSQIPFGWTTSNTEKVKAS